MPPTSRRIPSLELIATSAGGRRLPGRKAPTADTSSCSATPSTTRRRCGWNTSATWGRGLPVAAAATLLPPRRPRAGAARHLARPRAAALHQLAELLRLPDHALRPRKDRRRRTRARGRSVAGAGRGTGECTAGRGADGRGEHGAGSGAERTPAGEVRSACAAKPLSTPRQRRRRRLRSLLRPPRRTSPVRTGSVGLNRHHHCRGRWQHGIRRIG